MPRTSALPTALLLLPILLACTSEKEAAVLPPVAQTDFCADLHRDTTVSLARQLHPLDSLMATKTGVYVLEDGDEAMLARGWLSENAEHTIDVQYFIFSADNVGKIGADYLVRAADRGVRVRVLVDDLLLEADGEELIALDAHPNLEIRIYNPNIHIGKSLPGKLVNILTDFRGINQRMHNKTFTVDGMVTITGGRNIADEYFAYDHEYNFRDRDVLLLGGIVGQIQGSFDQFWTSPLSQPVSALVSSDSARAESRQRLEGLHQYACNPANYWPQIRERLSQIPVAFQQIQQSGALAWLDNVQFISDPPGKNDGSKGLGGGGATLTALEQLVRESKHSIDIQSPYLVTTDESRALLRDAVRRGVAVRILTNSLASTDNLEAFSGYQRDRKALLETGARVFEFRPDAAERMTMMTGALQADSAHMPVFGLHAKSMVVDGEITVIGTFNFDPRSANLNTECITIIRSKEIAGRVQAGMEREFQAENSWEATLASNPDHLADMKKRARALTRRVVPKGVL
ncbi:MAG: phospholipase D family protein [Gemmatimonadales bacterium]